MKTTDLLTHNRFWPQFANLLTAGLLYRRDRYIV